MLDAMLKEIAMEGAQRVLPRILILLEALCSVDSESGHEAGNRQVVEILRPVLEDLGAQVEEVYEPGLGTHLVARVLPEGHAVGKLILAAHLDTVFPVGSVAQHPFRIEGDYAWGLGVGDCKSGVLISLFGALILKEAGQLPPWELTYIFNCDEEIGSPSGQKLFARVAKDADCALVFEGGREQNGKVNFVTARRGVILGDIKIKGREAHAGAAYLEGRSAVLELANQIIRLYSFNDFEKGIYYNMAPISGGRPNGVVAGDAKGQFCVAGLPTNADFKIAEKNLASMAQQVTVDGCQVDVSWHTLFPAMERTKASVRLYTCVAAAAKTLDMEAGEISDPCATDAAWISTCGVPTVDALSALEYGIHTMDEHVSISSIQQRVALCVMVICSVCQRYKGDDLPD